MYKGNRPHIPVKAKMQGFSLIEFLVASALSLIVLLAVSSGYFTARTLNTAATSRLNVQQDLRNAANQIVRDARMAGNFGCFNMSGYDKKAVIADSGSNDIFKLEGSGTMLPAVRETKALGTSNFTQNGNALIFQYGIDKEEPEAATAVASSCTNITKPGTQIISSNAQSVLGADKSQTGNIAVMKHEVNAYVIGTAGGQQGLYRFQLTDNGTWSNPQLLIKGISSMEIHYFYAEGCPDSGDQSLAASAPTGTQPQSKDETFKYTQILSDKETPASIELLLNSGSINADGDSKNKVQVYRINATVRGGNTCADRSL